MTCVKPFEARESEIPDTVESVVAFQEVCVAVSGFYYPGDRSESLLRALGWLRTRPDLCDALGLNKDQ